MAAATYRGAVTGFVFKTDAGVTGYYRRSGWQARNAAAPAATSTALPRKDEVCLYDALGIGLTAIPISIWAALLEGTDESEVVRKSGITIALPSEHLKEVYTGVASTRRLRRVEPRAVKRARLRKEKMGSCVRPKPRAT